MSGKIINPDKQRIFDNIKNSAQEVNIALSLMNKEYTLDQYINFSLITLLNAAHLLPSIQSPVKAILNYWIDGQLQLEEKDKDLNNGILLIKE